MRKPLLPAMLVSAAFLCSPLAFATTGSQTDTADTATPPSSSPMQHGKRQGTQPHAEHHDRMNMLPPEQRTKFASLQTEREGR